MLSRGDWILIDSLQFVDNLFGSLATDEPLPDTSRRLFGALVGKLRQYARCSHGLHLTGNIMFGATGEPVTVEMDHLYVDPSLESFLLRALRERHGDKRVGPDGQLPLFVRLACREPVQVAGWEARLKDLLGGCPKHTPIVHARSRWIGLLDLLNQQRINATDQNGIALGRIDCSPTKVMVVTLSDPTKRFPCGQLGTVVLWSNTGNAVEEISVVRGERLKMAAKNLSVFASRLFQSQYGVRSDTYVPSYRVGGQRRVVVMFADIRGFTAITEICRNFGLVGELTDFIKEYTCRLSSLIQDGGGRVHGFTGDGIMAIFGEYDLDPCLAVERAIRTAKTMCHTFDAIMAKFFARPRLQRFFREEYEPLDMRLGIGLTFGPVIFDYFGSPGNREYGPLGDHVNFAQRLESEACRFDAQLTGRKDRMRAPILVSRPAWLAAGRDEAASSLALSVKGKPYEYQCYECWPDEQAEQSH